MILGGDGRRRTLPRLLRGVLTRRQTRFRALVFGSPNCPFSRFWPVLGRSGGHYALSGRYLMAFSVLRCGSNVIWSELDGLNLPQFAEVRLRRQASKHGEIPVNSSNNHYWHG